MGQRGYNLRHISRSMEFFSDTIYSVGSKKLMRETKFFLPPQPITITWTISSHISKYGKILAKGTFSYKVL